MLEIAASECGAITCAREAEAVDHGFIARDSLRNAARSSNAINLSRGVMLAAEVDRRAVAGPLDLRSGGIRIGNQLSRSAPFSRNDTQSHHAEHAIARVT